MYRQEVLDTYDFEPNPFIKEPTTQPELFRCDFSFVTASCPLKSQPEGALSASLYDKGSVLV